MHAQSITEKSVRRGRKLIGVIVVAPLVAGCAAPPYAGPWGPSYAAYSPGETSAYPGGWATPAPPAQPWPPATSLPIPLYNPLAQEPPANRIPPAVQVPTPAPQPLARQPNPHDGSAGQPPGTTANGAPQPAPPMIDADPPGSKCGWWRLCHFWE